VRYELLQYEHEPGAESYGLEAAAALDQAPGQVFKTLVTRIDGARLAVAVVPVDRTLDLKRFASATHAKRADLAPALEAERATGYVLGGISPLGQRKRLRTVVDASAQAFDRIYVSGGKRGLEIALAPDDLLALTGGSYAAISR
ncbi:MAG: Cys-tRNA(Pro) deacylase, partial [Gammaproteobacteria bacterium]